MKLKLFITVLCTVGISVSEGMELANDQDVRKIPSSIQHIPQDITVGILHFVDYQTLACSRQVCRTWKTLIDEKLPLSQGYILKYLAQFVQKKNPERTIKRFEEIFLAPLSDGPVGKMALDDIIDELQDELSSNKEQAYQTLLNRKLVSRCPSIRLEVHIDDNLETTKEFPFPYIPANLIQQGTEHVVEQDITLEITGQRNSPMQIFGISNLSPKILDRVIEVALYNITLLKIPKQLHKLQRWTQFSLSNSQMSSIPFELEQLTNLQKLDLYRNDLTNIPAEIGQLSNLKRLNLSYNELGSIPVQIGQLTNLHWLHLSRNWLSSIPAEISQLTNLQTLYLDSNQLSSIPVEISQLTNLQWLYLNNNQLSSIPVELGQLTELQQLYLDNNQITSIPAEIGQLTNLELLYLKDNQLSSIPAEISQLTNLQRLCLGNNQLDSIPAEIKKALLDCTIEI